MKRLLLLMLLSCSHFIYAQNKNPFQMEVGLAIYGANIAFSGVDINIGIPFYKNDIHMLSFQTTLLTYIPSSVLQPKAPYILFGGLWDLQYSLSLKNGFLFRVETGLGIASEFFQVPVYTISGGFEKHFISAPYGIFSSTIQIGYNFEKKFQFPFKLAFFTGYRMQFPYNFTVKHFILYGASLSYTFDFGGQK